MSTHYIGLKLGSTTTCIYKAGNGIVLKEPSLIAMPTNLKLKDIKALGSDAKKLIGRTSENITVYSPISNGVIQYTDLAVYMLKGFLKKVFPNKTIGQNIKAIVCTPLGLTPEEKKQFEIVCFKSGIAEVFLVPDIICYAIGSGIDIQSETAKLAINIGGDATNIAIISSNSIIKGLNLSIGGSLINASIEKFIEDKYNLSISLEQAENIKLEICSLIENYNANIEITGLNKASQVYEQITISSSELYPIVKLYYSKIAKTINSIIQSSEPEIISDIITNGIYFFGNASNIVGLENFMANETTFKVTVSNIEKSNILGTGELINQPQLLKKILRNN